MIVRNVGVRACQAGSGRPLRVLAAALAVAMAAMSGAARSEDTIKIGVPVPLSGSYSNAGTDILNGAKLAVAKINAQGGVLGKHLELLPVDDACDADTAATAAQKLVDAGVAAVVGGYCSSAALPELRIFHGANLPYVMDASTNPQLTEQGWDDVFRAIGRDDMQGPFAARFIKDVLHAKRVAVLNDNTTYSKGLADNAVAALKAGGVDVVADEAITPGQTDYSVVLSRLAKLPSSGGGSAAPDVVYYTGYFPEAAMLVKQGRQLGLAKSKVTFMGGDGTTDPTLIEAGGDAANGMILTTAPLPQFLPDARGFVTEYRNAYKRAPGPYSVYEYDAIGLTAYAIGEAKSAKPADISAALHKAHYKGVTGEIAFDKKGDRMAATYITIVVRDNAFKPYKQMDANGQWMPIK